MQWACRADRGRGLLIRMGDGSRLRGFSPPVYGVGATARPRSLTGLGGGGHVRPHAHCPAGLNQSSPPGRCARFPPLPVLRNSPSGAVRAGPLCSGGAQRWRRLRTGRRARQWPAGGRARPGRAGGRARPGRAGGRARRGPAGRARRRPAGGRARRRPARRAGSRRLPGAPGARARRARLGAQACGGGGVSGFGARAWPASARARPCDRYRWTWRARRALRAPAPARGCDRCRRRAGPGRTWHRRARR